jgi:hypothetical protein
MPEVVPAWSTCSFDLHTCTLVLLWSFYNFLFVFTLVFESFNVLLINFYNNINPIPLHSVTSLSLSRYIPKNGAATVRSRPRSLRLFDGAKHSIIAYLLGNANLNLFNQLSLQVSTTLPAGWTSQGCVS